MVDAVAIAAAQNGSATRKPSLGETLLAPTQDFLVSGGVLIILLFFLLASEDLFLRKVIAVFPHLREKKIAV